MYFFILMFVKIKFCFTASHNSHGATLFLFLNIIVSGCNVLIGFGIGIKVATEQKGSSGKPSSKIILSGKLP